MWRSLVARSVRVGEVPSSNLGTPIYHGGTQGSPVNPLLNTLGDPAILRLSPGTARLRPRGAFYHALVTDFLLIS